MASANYNAGIKGIQDRSIDYASDTINIMILATATPYTFDQDATTMTTAALSEMTVGGYARKTLASKTITNDTINNRAVYDAADPSAWTLASGQTASGAIVFKATGSDATSVPISFLDFTDTPTNGGTFTIQFDANGIAYIQN